MIHLLNVEEWAERYHKGNLSPAELKSLHQSLEEDKVLNEAFEQALQIQVMLKAHSKKSQLKAQLNAIAKQHEADNIINQNNKNTIKSNTNQVFMLVKKYWKPAAAAACIALFTSTLTYTLTKDKGKHSQQYVTLKRDIESIKKSQNQIIQGMKQTEASNQNKIVVNPGSAAGSAFAISNDGYFTTNYHVVERADSVYLQMNDGRFLKANVIKVNHNADLAILKIEDKSFNFKQAIPYTIEKNIAQLGQKIFSIGYPKDEVVYNEGYISSEKGFDGNTLAYQLEMTANPGQSGAPILDTQGNVVGVVTGKQFNTSGTTYAVHAEQLTKMIAELPKAQKVNLSNKSKFANLSRTEQVKQLRDYVVAVRVYK